MPPTLTVPIADVLKKISTATETKSKNFSCRSRINCNISHETVKVEAAFGGGCAGENLDFLSGSKNQIFRIIFFLGESVTYH